jgi:hypothetical protein
MKITTAKATAPRCFNALLGVGSDLPVPPERLAHLFRGSDRRKPQTNVGLTAEILGTWRGCGAGFFA